MNALENVFEGIISDVRSECNLNQPKKDKIRIMFTSDTLKKPLSTRLVTVQEQSSSLMSEISKVLQGEENLQLDESFIVDVVTVGRGKSSYKVLNYEKHSKLKKSIIKIKNTDSL